MGKSAVTTRSATAARLTKPLSGDGGVLGARAQKIVGVERRCLLLQLPNTNNEFSLLFFVRKVRTRSCAKIKGFREGCFNEGPFGDKRFKEQTAECNRLPCPSKSPAVFMRNNAGSQTLTKHAREVTLFMFFLFSRGTSMAVLAAMVSLLRDMWPGDKKATPCMLSCRKRRRGLPPTWRSAVLSDGAVSRETVLE